MELSSTKAGKDMSGCARWDFEDRYGTAKENKQRKERKRGAVKTKTCPVCREQPGLPSVYHWCGRCWKVYNKASEAGYGIDAVAAVAYTAGFRKAQEMAAKMVDDSHGGYCGGDAIRRLRVPRRK